MNALNRQREHLREPGLDLRPWRRAPTRVQHHAPRGDSQAITRVESVGAAGSITRRTRLRAAERPGAQLEVPGTFSSEVNLSCRNTLMLGVLVLGAIALSGCADLIVHDTASLLAPRFQRSEIVGLVAGAGTTFAALPDLIAMLRRRSSKGMNPRMAGIMGVFQLGWIYYGLLIDSRPVVGWNMIAVVINFLSVAAYARFARRERNAA
jgi:MtN3 and saliva related transmembrane protein